MRVLVCRIALGELGTNVSWTCTVLILLYPLPPPPFTPTSCQCSWVSFGPRLDQSILQVGRALMADDSAHKTHTHTPARYTDRHTDGRSSLSPVPVINTWLQGPVTAHSLCGTCTTANSRPRPRSTSELVVHRHTSIVACNGTVTLAQSHYHSHTSTVTPAQSHYHNPTTIVPLPQSHYHSHTSTVPLPQSHYHSHTTTVTLLQSHYHSHTSTVTLAQSH